MILAGTARIAVIGDTKAGVLGAVLIAAVLIAAALIAAPDAGEVIAASAVRAAVGDWSSAVRTEPAGCAGSEFVTTDAGCADDPFAALGEAPCPAACVIGGAASVGIDGVPGAVIVAGMEPTAVAGVGDTCCGATEPDAVEALPELVAAADAAAPPPAVEALSTRGPGVPVGAGGGTAPGGSALPVPVGDAFGVSLCGPPGSVPWRAAKPEAVLPACELVGPTDAPVAGADPEWLTDVPAGSPAVASAHATP